jgi:4-amino-4-deoxy-L-arabinose transferase
MMLVGIFLALYVVPLGVRPLVIPDETRYAEIPREMLASGDWVVPRLNGLRYFEKPPLGHWLNAASIWLFGENAFAVRLPSAVAAGLTAVLLFVWTRRFTNDDATPWLATTVFLLSFEVLAIGTFCVLDSMLSLFTTAAIVAFHFAYGEKTARTRTVLLVLAGLACALAFLTKGFLALVVPAIVIVPFMLWEGRFKTLLRMAWLPLVAAILVVLPWAVTIHRREPDFWHYFFWVEHVNRFISPDGGQHRLPFWFYVPILLGGAMPWTPLLGPIVQGLRHTSWRDSTIRLAICWLVPPLLFFSACSGKLGTYILPCYPPLAFLIAVGVLKCLGEGDVKGFVTGAWVLVYAAGLLLVALLVGLFVVPELSDSVALWKWAIAAAGLLLWGALCRAATTSKDVRSRLALYCAGPVLFMFTWPLVIPAAISAEKAPGAFLTSEAARIPQDGVLVAENALTAAVCWYCKRDDVFILGRTGEYAYGLDYDDSRQRVLSIDQFRNMVADLGRTAYVTLIITTQHHAEYEGQLPSPSYRETYDGLVWVEYAPASGSAVLPPVLPD